MTRRSKTSKTIYIGPNLTGGRLAHATVFDGGYPPHIEELMNGAPWFKNLFVPVEKYAEKTQEASRRGTSLFVFMARCREL